MLELLGLRGNRAGRTRKILIVCAGYALAVLAGIAAGALYNARVSKLPYDTSGGMYAGGELLQSTAAFLGAALIPTVLALWYLRASGRFWHLVALASLAFAITGLIAVLMPLAVDRSSRHPLVALIDLFSLAQMLGVPLWTAAFALFAFIAPTRPARRLLVAAVGLEMVIGVCAAIHWFLPRPPF
jgi:hypothetical protein